MTNELTPEKLDAKWRELADGGDDTAKSLDARLQRAAEDFESTLAELRDLARMKFHEMPKCSLCGSGDRVKKHPSKDGNICWSCYTGFES